MENSPLEGPVKLPYQKNERMISNELSRPWRTFEINNNRSRSSSLSSFFIYLAEGDKTDKRVSEDK